MTVAPEKAATPAPQARPVPPGHVRLAIDGIEVDAPKGELIIRTAERLGIIVPRFCDHPLLEPAGACRQCLVEVELGGRPMPKPQASCTMTVADGMVVRTQHTSAVADKAQQGVMELLLINHPLDCPICDKGGECPLQNQALAHGRADSRFHDHKRTFAKPLPISSQVLLDRERCVLCQRCTRFSEQIAGDPFIDLLERGALQQIGTATGKPFQSYFSGNTIQICPVGALTSAAYRFRSRPFDLVSTPGVCEHCASGCALRTDWRRGQIQRRLAGADPEVNEEWNCDKGRFGFAYVTGDRITRPLVRNEDGRLHETSWTEALRVAAEGLVAARSGRGAGVLAGGRCTVEDAYAYGKFARVALGTNDVDFRARPGSDEELAFLADRVAGRLDEGVTYAELAASPVVLCVAFDPEDESPIVFLRLRKAVRAGTTTVVHVGPYTTPAVRKTGGNLVRCAPGEEATALGGLPEGTRDLVAGDGAVILVGERAAELPGLFDAVTALAADTGARVAWVPRRAGERGAVEVGALPTLLPGGRPVADARARTALASAWGLAGGAIPAAAGRDTAAMLAAAAAGQLDGLVVGGVDPDDLADPAAARAALAAVGFLVSLELRHSAVTAQADVVLPVAPAVHKNGSFLNWEGRRRPFDTTIESVGALSDCRVLDTLAVEMDADLHTQTPAAAWTDYQRTLAAVGGLPSAPTPEAVRRQQHRPGRYGVRLATWRQLIDEGSLQDGEPHLKGTARAAVARISEARALLLGVKVGEEMTVSTEHGAITLPVALSDLPDDVVWLPTRSADCRPRIDLRAGPGDVVTLTAGRAGPLAPDREGDYSSNGGPR
jgi:NADH-quinone oxidoreductase subunit G